MADSTRHITAAERSAWNGKAPSAHTHWTVGTYTGTGSIQTVNIGSRISCVIVFRLNNSIGSNLYDTLAAAGAGYPATVLDGTGKRRTVLSVSGDAFTVDDIYMGKQSTTYLYIAFKG